MQWGRNGEAKLLHSANVEPARTQYYLATGWAGQLPAGCDMDCSRPEVGIQCPTRLLLPTAAGMNPLALIRLIWRKHSLRRSVGKRRRHLSSSKQQATAASRRGLLSSIRGQRQDSSSFDLHASDGQEPFSWVQEEQQQHRQEGSGSGRLAPRHSTAAEAQRSADGGRRAPALLLRRRSGSQAGSRDGSAASVGRLISEAVEVHLVIGNGGRGSAKGADAAAKYALEQQAGVAAAKAWSQEAAEVGADVWSWQLQLLTMNRTSHAASSVHTDCNPRCCHGASSVRRGAGRLVAASSRGATGACYLMQDEELQRLNVEIAERFGGLFEDFRGHSPWTAGFK